MKTNFNIGEIDNLEMVIGDTISRVIGLDIEKVQAVIETLCHEFFGRFAPCSVEQIIKHYNRFGSIADIAGDYLQLISDKSNELTAEIIKEIKARLCGSDQSDKHDAA